MKNMISKIENIIWIVLKKIVDKLDANQKLFIHLFLLISTFTIMSFVVPNLFTNIYACFVIILSSLVSSIIITEIKKGE
jgi:hypothetical protein